MILHKGLRMQHDRVYAFNRQTEYGEFEGPCDEMTRKFLELVHHDEGGRIFTYVILLDGLMRFTETGKEFGIDFLSKHTMHSDASIYIAFSGEFFIRRMKYPDRDPPEMAEAKANHRQQKQAKDKGQSSHTKSDKDKDAPQTIHGKEANEQSQNETHPASSVEGGPPKAPPTRDPHYYEIIIDNDSGTYRPNSELFPQLRKFLESNLIGLKITTLDSQNDKELMDRLKNEQRAIKKSEGHKQNYAQVDDASSLSSEDVETMQRKAEQDQDDNDEGTPTAKHKLGEAMGPMLGNHANLRKVVGAAER